MAKTEITEGELNYYDGTTFKALEFEEQARVRRLARDGYLRIDNTVRPSVVRRVKLGDLLNNILNK